MRRKRFTVALVLFSVLLLVFAPGALAHSDSGGQGWDGETNDTVITNAMFLVILFFPVIISLFSFIQWRLDKRKHARMDAAKRRAVSADWRGGW
jgi:heme/copper-type cytochrome/quinol oxidase subunit 2